MATITRTQNTLTRRDSSGAIYALSSDGVTEYRVSLSPAACACVGFTHRQTCRHWIAAAERYGDIFGGCPVCALSPLARCWSCAAQKPAPQPEPCVGDMYPCDCPRCRKGAA